LILAIFCALLVFGTIPLGPPGSAQPPV